VVAAGIPVIGIDVGGTKMRGRAVDPAEPTRVLAEARVDTPLGGSAIVAGLDELVAGLRGDLAGRGLADAGAVGIGIAGLVDLSGMLRIAPNLPGVTDLDVATPLADASGLPVSVDNDANCATVAEHRVGAGIGADELVMVTLGTGIGGGVVVGGRLQRGAAGFAGEPGHMVVDPNGPQCPCGQRGCWERYASGSGLGRLARDAALAGRAGAVVALAGGDPEDVRGEHVTRAAADGDEEARAVLADFGWWVALGIANLQHLLDPEVVVIGGGLAEAGELLLAPVRTAYARLVIGYAQRPKPRVVGAQLGPEAGAIGAALLAAD
jgi:glucokinase